ERKDVLEPVVEAAGHILRTQDRTAESLQLPDATLHLFGGLIVMEADDIRFLEHKAIEFLDLFVAPLPYPHAGRQRLIRIHFPGPTEGLPQQRQGEVGLVRGLMRTIGRRIPVAGFVEEIPYMNPGIMRKMGDDALDISFQTVVTPGIAQYFQSRTLQPS